MSRSPVQIRPAAPLKSSSPTYLGFEYPSQTQALEHELEERHAKGLRRSPRRGEAAPSNFHTILFNLVHDSGVFIIQFLRVENNQRHTNVSVWKQGIEYSCLF